MKKSYEYVVFHGWLATEPTATFKSRKKAIDFIESQPDADDWCFDKVERHN